MHRALAPAAVYRLRAHLRRGGVIAYPTESVYGLGCLPTHARALRRLMAIKARPQHKGLISIGADSMQLQPLLAPLTTAQQLTLQQQWPAAKTFLIPARHTVLPALRGRGRKVLAVRVPAHSGARRLCRQAGSALVSSSCNRAGMRPYRHERDVRRRFGRQVWVVGGRCGGKRNPSQIIDLLSGVRLR
ncbi:L-threonylcarbamoyladenylate synthase [Neisseria sp. HSC-16F19]|nr:L-threonylcarbamoyladenylate synthase [Neisseria sp. HSC-16F19]MCP2039954.1 L-threonylcarbamoyladenylate synthase [Neisseria sp. HSC-16F19]